MTLTQPYQSASGDWIVFDGVTKHRFDTEAEAYVWRESMSKKTELAQAVVADVQSVAGIMDDGPDALQRYFDSGYTYTDEDLAELGITATQFTACLTLLENIDKFFGGTNPTNTVYRVTVNAVR